ncbi:MAG TPA: DUF4188 domain-containing protein [Cellulomonas sp.]
MANSIDHRVVTHDYDHDVTVFIIGMRINRARALREWWPVFTIMPKMQAELAAAPDSGYLGGRNCLSGRTILSIQYWRSAADLEHYARNPDQLHRPAWTAFNTRSRASTAVGIFHETYVVPAGNHESLYRNLPLIGLAAATHGSVEVGARSAEFRDRLHLSGH